MKYLALLLSLLYLFAYSKSIIPIFSSTYSQSFSTLTSSADIPLSESFFSGEENQAAFSISLWLKIINSAFEGQIFSIKQYIGLENSASGFYFFPELQYSPPGYLTLKWYYKYDLNFSKLSLKITPSTNWVFIAISASFELKSILFYYNELGSEIYELGHFLSRISIKFSSTLKIGGEQCLYMRIGDFKFYNNIYNEVSDWNSIYSNSCSGVSCADLFPSICYAQCDQWCKAQAEWFLPLLQPVLYTSSAPYYEVNEKVYAVYKDNIDYDLNIPTNGWSDYSVTGWVQFPVCHSEVTTFFQFMSNYSKSFSIGLVASSLSSLCDTLEGTIYSTDGLNSAPSSVSLSSSSYIGNWFFVAATVNSASKLFTLYSQNGANPPSASYPLLSISLAYPYTAYPFLLSIVMYIGGDISLNLYPGNYADFRVYPGNHIDTTLLQYNNNIYSAATYLDPHCILWESIWHCKACKSQYFIKNGICQKCHPSCVACSTDDTETNCLSCASEYYAQPDHPAMCFNYCPLGYSSDSFLNQCIGTQGVIASINFDDNLSGNFYHSNIYVKLGMDDNYYPDLDFTDPLPANKRGIYMDHGWIRIYPQDPAQAERIFSTDFTIQIWAMAQSNGDLYSVSSTRLYNTCDEMNYCPTYIYSYKIQDSRLSFMMHQNIDYFEFASNIIDIPFKKPEWALYTLSLSYNALLKSTQVILARNADHFIGTFPGYYKEFDEATHNIVNQALSVSGFMYNLLICNYGKSYSEIQLNLGTCNDCSACSAALNHCLPTCDKTEYVDENGNCQKCLSSCSGICSRGGTCNLCYDDLCYKCSKYEIGTCSQCIQHAKLKNGQCECESGYINQGSQCVNKCEDGYYLDLNAQSCLSCPINCLKCRDEKLCTICKTGYEEIDGKCGCQFGFFADSHNKCIKCSNSCLTCSISPSNCTSCTSSLPILYDSNKCYPCESFEGYSTYFSIPSSYFTDDLRFQLSSNCIEICGDGRNMGQAQCDDGNINNGDGCSSACVIEAGWSCYGGSLNSPDICKDTTPPLPLLTYLRENNSGYLLTLYFTEAVIARYEMSKSIKIEVDGFTKFSWSISLEKSIYIIELDFYENVDSGTSVTVTFIEPSSIVDVRGNEMQESIAKTNLLNSFTYQLGQQMEKSVTTVATSAATVTAIGSMFSLLAFGTLSLQALWGMIEMMQMQYYLIFLSLKYPGNLLSYIRALSISNGNFLPNPFKKYLIKKDPFPYPPEIFSNESFSTDFIMNAGPFLLVWLVILICLLITLLLFKLFPKVAIIRWLKKSYLFSILLRLGIESFLPITLSVFLQLREISKPNQNIGYLSLALSFITMTYLILSFALIAWQVALKSSEELSTRLHKTRFGTIYEPFKSSSKLNQSFILFQNLRRVFFVFFCVFLYEYAEVQVALSAMLSFLYTILLIVLRPFQPKILGNGLHIASEALYFSAHCLILKFLDSQLSENERTRFGWITIAILSFSLSLHLFALFIVEINSLIQGLKQLKENFWKNFNNKFVERRHNLKTIVLDGKAWSEREENKIEEINEDADYSKIRRRYEETDWEIN